MRGGLAVRVWMLTIGAWLLALFAPLAAAAGGDPPGLRIERLASVAADAPVWVAREARGTPVVTLGGSGGNGWWRITIDDPGDRARVLVLADTYGGTVTLVAADTAVPVRAMRFDPQLRQPGSRHRLVFDLSAAAQRAPLLLHLDGLRSVPIRAQLVAADDYAREDRMRVRLSTLVHGGLLVIAATAITNSVALRAWPLLLFAGWAIAMTGYLLGMSGEIEAIPGGAVLLPHSLRVAYLSAQVGVVLAFPFFVWFLGLRQKMPRSAAAIHGCAAAVLVMFVVTAVSPALPSWIANISNTALMIGQAVLVLATMRLAWQGKRNARFLLLAWVPTILATQLRAAGFAGWIPIADWTELVYPFAVLFAALVLNLVLAASARSVADAHRSLEGRVDRDPLTGLANRAALARAATQQLQHAAATGQPLGVLFLDVDRFKPINDNWGHAYGDAVLKAFADAVRAELRSNDLLARYGGEEFVVLLPATQPEQAAQMAERIRLRVQRQCREVDTRRVDLTVSIGVASSRDVGGSVEALLHAADSEVYRAKRDGRNCVRMREPGLLNAAG